jgi:hypothetical protein
LPPDHSSHSPPPPPQELQITFEALSAAVSQITSDKTLHPLAEAAQFIADAFRAVVWNASAFTSAALTGRAIPPMEALGDAYRDGVG